MKLHGASSWIEGLAAAPLVLALLAVALLVLAPSTRIAAAGAGTQPITIAFDHVSTGFELDGVHRDLPCEACHLNAVFKGTPRNCGVCHITGSTFNATPKTRTHIQSTNDCAACHNTISFRPAVHFDHHEVMGNCVSCHNGTIAQGKGPTHPQTSNLCEACHLVMTWNPPKAVDHTQIPLAVQGFCIICHNGVQASGKTKTHIATNLECGDCHLTTTWLGANFDHIGIVNGCASCHNGIKAVGKQGNHMPTSNLCEYCHTTGIGTKTPSWAPSAFDHTQMAVQTCATCHNGTVKVTTGYVSGLPTTHLPLATGIGAPDCGLCHGNTPTAETWTVLAASIATLHSGLTTNNCLMCHAGQTFAGVPAPYIPMSISGVSPTKKTPLVPPHIPILAGTDCSACHGAAYTAGGFGPATAMSAGKHAFVSTTCDSCHDTGKSFYLGSGTPLQLRPANHINSTDPQMASGDCSACHNTTDWTSKVMPAGHMPNPSNLPCVTCHTSAPNDYTPATLAANSVLHTGITGNCALCHGDNVTALTWANNFTPKDAILAPLHISYLSGTDCSSCHSSATYATGTFGPMNMTQAKHAFVPTSCNTCHDASAGTFYLGASTPSTMQVRPADHTTPDQVAPNDCSNCHTPASWTSNKMPAGHMPNPGNQACSVCHTAIGTAVASYATLASIAVLHTGITSNCGQCHGGPAGPLTFYNNNDNPKAAVLTPVHMPYLSGADCSSCHTANYVAGGFGPISMSAAKHAFVATACDSCHTSSAAPFYMGASTPLLQLRPANHTAGQQATGDCSGCHNTTDWTSTVMPAGHMPNPGNQNCSVCHIGAPNTYSTFASVTVLHTGIAGNCSQCHGNSTALAFYNNGDIPNEVPKYAASVAHIPYLNGVDCSSCHATSYITGGFGPATAMSAAKHAFVPTTCNSCHDTNKGYTTGTGTPLQLRPTDHTTPPNSTQFPQRVSGDCSGCHNTTDWTNAAVLPPNHMPNPGAQACVVCHLGAPSNFVTPFTSISVMHTGISTGCDQCHGGMTQLLFTNNDMVIKAAKSLSPAHIPAFNGEDCSSCHTPNYVTGGFGPMNMTQATHNGVGTTCNSCHEAGLNFYMGNANPKLQGRPADHTAGNMAAPNDCSICHTTATWNSTALPSGHMPNPANTACNVCHTTAPTNYKVFAANSVMHTGIAGNCAQCHGAAAQLSFYNNDMVIKDGVLAPAHIPYIAGTDCANCHKTATYAVGTFGPMNMTQATHAFVPTTCDTCHGVASAASFTMGAANPALQLRPADHQSGTMLTGDCGGCHTTSNWNSNMMPAGHMPNPANTACNVCHTSAPANYKVFAANSVMHTGITSNCAQCHGATQLSFYNNDLVVKAAVLAPAHIPYLAGADCGSCHKSTTFAAGSFSPMNMSQATHAFVPTTCDTCHGVASAANFTMGAANPKLQLRPADHTSGTMLTGDCGGCHTTATWISNALPAGHMPNPGNQGCNVCHIATATTYATMASITVLHTGITTNCILCHGQTQLSFYNNNDPPKPMIVGHIPSLKTPCESCHTGFASFVTSMNSAKHTLLLADTGGTCDQCHEIGKSFANLNMKVRPDPGHFAGRDCNGCHNTNQFGGGAAKKTAAAAATTRSTIALVVNKTAAPRGATTGLASAALASGVATPGHATLGVTRGVGGTAAAPMSHAGVITNCVSCHNGVLAAGKGATHIASNNACENCHTTLAWLPARFDHRGVTASCVGCHNGVLASGKPTRHVHTAEDCSSCHGTVTWAAATFNHFGITATCQSCHNSITATGKQVGHLSTALDCGSCHSTLNWTVTTPAAPLKPLLRKSIPTPVPRGANGGSNK